MSDQTVEPIHAEFRGDRLHQLLRMTRAGQIWHEVVITDINTLEAVRYDADHLDAVGAIIEAKQADETRLSLDGEYERVEQEHKDALDVGNPFKATPRFASAMAQNDKHEAQIRELEKHLHECQKYMERSMHRAVQPMIKPAPAPATADRDHTQDAIAYSLEAASLAPRSHIKPEPGDT